MLEALKVLMLLENAGAGSGRHVIDLSKGLLSRGHRVHLLYSPYRLEKWFEDGVVGIEDLTALQVPMMREPSYRDIKGVEQINRYIRKHGPFDVIHGHSSKGGAIARIAGSMNKSARVYTPHAFYTLDTGLNAPKRHLYRLLEHILAKFSDGIICVSRDEYKHALSLHISPNKLFVVNNGIGPLAMADRRTSRRRLGVGEDEVCIGFVGRLAPQKSIDRLIRAFAQVFTQLPSARLAIVGDGPDGAKLQNFASSLNLGDSIIWVGQGDGPDLMAGFDIFAMSSRYEAFPYVLLEAAARGLPIITTDVGGAREIISSGKSGVIVEQDDNNKYFSHILRLCKDSKKRQEMSIYAGETIKDFTVDRMVSETIDVYTACLVKSTRSKLSMDFPNKSRPIRRKIPMNIVHCFRSPVGGLFRHVCDQVRGQVGLGLNVGVICDSLTGGGYAKHMLGQLASDCGVTVHRIPMCRTLGWIDKAALNKTNEICRTLAPDIFHGHGAKGGAYARLIARRLGVKAVYTPHGGSLHYHPKRPSGIFYLAFERLLKFISDGIIFESKFSQETYIQKIGAIHGLHQVIHNGLLDDEFEPAVADENSKDFLFVGELRMLKGVDILLQAAALLQSQRQISLQIVGDGPDLDLLKSRIRELDLEAAVTIGPRIFPVNQTFSLAKFIVIPSLKESLPYIVLEAAAAKIPQLTTNVGGVPEIFGPYADRLIPSANPEVLASAMGQAIDDPKSAEEFALLLQKRVKTFFRAENMVRATVDFYEHVLSTAHFGLTAKKA